MECHEAASWHLHDPLLLPFLSLAVVVLYRFFHLCTGLVREISGPRPGPELAVFFFRVLAAGFWLGASVHRQFHVVLTLATCSELVGFSLSYGFRWRGPPWAFSLLQPRLYDRCFQPTIGRLRALRSSAKSRPLPSPSWPRRSSRRLGKHSPSRWKVCFLLYLCSVDASALRIGLALGGQLTLTAIHLTRGVQLIAHGFHEGRPVFSTGTIPAAHSEADLSEVVPLGRSCNLLLPPSTRPRRQVAVFLGRPGEEPPLVPCPLTMLADERLHDRALLRRMLLNLGVTSEHPQCVQLQSPLPGLPSEQLLFLPSDLGWNDVIVPVDLRPLGGSICLVRGERSHTCGQMLAAALEVQGRFRALHGVLGRCCLGWFSLGSQPLILPSVDALQFAYGPEPGQVQPLFGTSLEPPFTLDTLMQVSAIQTGPPLELFSGFSANHAVLLTPNGLVYVEVPVFADSNTYRRLVSLQASPTARGGIMRLWHPLSSLPHVQFLEVHCSGTQVPCVLDFRPTGWRIVTTCVELPVTPARALEAAVDDGLDLPSEWPLTCRSGGFGILHKETAVAATQTLQGGAPFVLLFFPHVFTHDDDSSGHAVGGREAWDKSASTTHTLPLPLPGQAGATGNPAGPPVVELGPPASPPLQAASPYDIVADTSLDVRGADADVTLATSFARSGFPAGGLLCMVLGVRVSSRFFGLTCVLQVAYAMLTQSEPPSPRFVIESPKPALDSARLAPPSERINACRHIGTRAPWM